MKTNERALLAACIDTGIYAGWTRAHKHTDTPHELRIQEEIDNAIWYEIDQYFVFDSERDLCDEVAEGFDELQNTRHVCQLTPGSLHLKDHEASQKTGRYVCVCENWQPEEVDRLRAKKKQIYEDLKDAVDNAVDRKGEGLKWFLFEENGEEYFFPASTDAEALESAKKRGATLVREATKCEYTCEGNREWVGLTREEQGDWIWELTHKNINVWDLCDRVEAKLKEKNHD